MTLTLAQDDVTSAPVGAQSGATVGGTESTTTQDSTKIGADTAKSRPGSGMDLTVFLPLIVLMAIVMIFSSRGQKKERKKHADMLSTLKKGDKVKTVGGILGTVVEVRDSEVVLKVDENANTRLRFARAAIQTIMTEDKEASS